MSKSFPGDAGGLLAGYAAGSRLAGYQLEERLGVGGMAVVFRARDERLDRLVALKILIPSMRGDDEFRQRFILESRAAAAVDHPHIIPVFEAGEADGVLFIAMRHVPGGDVHTLIRRMGPLPPGRAVAIVSSVASALDAAHGVGLVHRDVKPANMLVDTRSGRPDHVYLSDFGLSKRTLSAYRLTGPGQFLGTPGYCAPEQMEGKPADGGADQYGLACAAFAMLSGSPPFPRDKVAAVMWAHMHEPPKILTSVRPDLPVAVNGVLVRALAKRPEERYANCREFGDALRSALGLEPYNSGPALSSHTNFPRTKIAWLIGPGTKRQSLPGAAATAEVTDGPGSSQQLTVDTARKGRMSRQGARHAGSHTQSGAVAPPSAAQNQIGPNLIPAAEQGRGPRSHIGDGDALVSPLESVFSTHPATLTRRRMLLAGTACASAIGLSAFLWRIDRGNDAPSAEHNRERLKPGTLIWRTSFSFSDGARRVMAVGSDVVYVVSYNYVQALNVADGSQKWSRKHSAYNMTATADGVYLTDFRNELCALRSTDGKQLWRIPLGPSGPPIGRSGPAVDRGMVYTGTGSHKLYALRARDGAQIWDFPVAVRSNPVAYKDVVYFLGKARSNNFPALYAVRASDGAQIWDSPGPGGGSLAAGQDVVCVLEDREAPTLRAWRSSDGTKLWTSHTNGGFVSLAIADDMVYAISASGELLALRSSDGRKLWGFPVNVNLRPAVGKDILYVGRSGGGLVALRARDGKPIWHSSAYLSGGPALGASAVYVNDNTRVDAFSTQ